jgi:hypothetical protein
MSIFSHRSNESRHEPARVSGYAPHPCCRLATQPPKQQVRLTDSAKSLSDQKIATRAHQHTVNRRSEQYPEIALVESQQHRALSCQRGNQHRLVFGRGQQQRFPASQRIWNPLDLGLHVWPPQDCLLSKLPNIFAHFRMAIAGRDQTPGPVVCDSRDQPGKRFP